MRTSVELPDNMGKQIKDYNNTHKGHPINVSGALQECLEKLLAEIDPLFIPDVDDMYNNWVEYLETKQECRMWLMKKLVEDPPKFTLDPTIIRCPACGEEQLISNPFKKCVNCDTNPDDTKSVPNPHAPAQGGEGSGGVCGVCGSTDDVERYPPKEKGGLNPGDGFVEYCKKHAIKNGYAKEE